MELAAIIAGLLIAVGGMAALAGSGLHAWMAGHHDRLRALAGRAGALARGHAARRQARGVRSARSARSPRASWAAGNALTLTVTLALGMAAVTLTAVGLGALADNVTHGDGMAVLDHPVARFVVGHRTPLLTSVMKAISAAAGPAALTASALAAGLLLGLAWRSWTPPVVLAATAAGAIGLTIVVKEVLARPRPPLIHAVAAADGHGFPSGHAAAAAAVCGAAAWLCSARIRSWRAQAGIWAAAAMLVAPVASPGCTSGCTG